MKLRALPLLAQLCVSLFFVALVSGVCYLFKDFTGHRVVAFVLLFVVSFLALLLEVLPVLFAALLSALSWNFFFIPPVFTFHIDNAEDGMLFLMYFVVALLNAVFLQQIRKAERALMERQNEERKLNFYSTLLNSLSHELKTPLAAILGYTDVLKSIPQKENNDQIQLVAKEIDEAASRLHYQVDNLLNLSRLESGFLALKPDWVDLNESLFKWIQGFPNHQKNIHFYPNEVLPLYKTDSFLLEQIVTNLLANALIHNHSEVSIQLSIFGDESSYSITIDDDGKGMDAQELARVFDKFYRNPQAKPGGSGLGLSIVKGFTEALNGTIEVDSELGKGTTFSITIPSESTYISQLKHE